MAELVLEHHGGPGRARSGPGSGHRPERWRGHYHHDRGDVAGEPGPGRRQVVGLREAFENHLPGVASLDALCTARHTDSTFPKHVAKRGSAFLYRVGDLKRWARNRPRAASGTTDLEDD